jgi:micrococcal nuclease
MRKPWPVTGLVGTVLFGAACAASPHSPDRPGRVEREPQPPSRAFDARVERVVDGDTFIAVRRGERLRVRLIGIDAPESARPDHPVECWGPKSSRELSRLVPSGSRVRAAYQDGGRRDRYGRELWDVWTLSGTFVQSRLVRRGASEAVAYPPQTDHADRLDELERAARRDRRGLWGAC